MPVTIWTLFCEDYITALYCGTHFQRVSRLAHSYPKENPESYFEGRARWLPIFRPHFLIMLRPLKELNKAENQQRGESLGQRDSPCRGFLTFDVAETEIKERLS